MQRPVVWALLSLWTVLLVTGSALSQSSVPQARQFFDQARQALAEGDAQKAIDLYSKVIEADPQFVEAYLKLGELLAVLDRFEEAKAVFQKAGEIMPRRGATCCGHRSPRRRWNGS